MKIDNERLVRLFFAIIIGFFALVALLGIVLFLCSLPLKIMLIAIGIIVFIAFTICAYIYLE